ncbi:hypothetical protein BHM03_00034156 [Ensete ventricosum]|nr:hypothetical protein BHM03_00034156 [Ensete ventricosum]
MESAIPVLSIFCCAFYAYNYLFQFVLSLKIWYAWAGKTDPFVVLTLGDQVFRSKKNSQTTVTGPPGEPIWNQDFDLFVVNPGKQKLYIQVKDSFGFADFTVGTAEVD